VHQFRPCILDQLAHLVRDGPVLECEQLLRSCLSSVGVTRRPRKVRDLTRALARCERCLREFERLFFIIAVVLPTTRAPCRSMIRAAGQLLNPRLVAVHAVLVGDGLGFWFLWETTEPVHPTAGRGRSSRNTNGTGPAPVPRGGGRVGTLGAPLASHKTMRN